jgi:DNA recombination protein RmuC
MEWEVIIVLILGILTGGALGFFAAKLQSGKKQETLQEEKMRLETKLVASEEQLKKYNLDYQELNRQLQQERERMMEVNQEKATLTSDYRHLKERLEEQKGEIQELQERFALQFRNLANDIFEEKSKKFTDQNKTNLHELLKPLGERISEFEKKVDQTHKDTIDRNSALGQQLKMLQELNQQMSKEAENLTRALKGDTKMQGNWGELVLERILEQSGLEKGREYFTQESFNTEMGKRLRPDVIVKLPDEKNLVIDAKVSLTAYEKFVNAETEEERQQYLKEHLLSVRTHVKGLSEKNYYQLFDSGSLDYVLMFMPIEAAFAMIMHEGGALYEEAHHKNIIIVSPTTLIATLRTIASIWKHEYQNQNALEIARQGGALYDKFKSFVDDLIKVGQSMKQTQNTYEEAMKKLVDGKDNLIRKTERLRELGAKTSKVMDQKLLDRANSEELPQNTAEANLFSKK